MNSLRFVGRAYAIRTCLKIGGIEFTDSFITFPELVAAKGTIGYSEDIPLGSVPVITLPTGQVVTQSQAISRYAAKLANLYPTDPLQALFVDELVDVVGDILSSAPQNADAAIKKELREKWADGKLKIFMNYLNKKVTEAGPLSFLVEGKLSLADLYVYASLKSILKGSYDYVPPSYLDAWPALLAYVAFYESDHVVGPFKFE